MLQTSTTQSFTHAGAFRRSPASSNGLTALVYRSRAVQPLSGTELHWLTKIAVAKNRAEAVTGILVYDDECFYQWLEGPRASLARVMQSIQNDPRHTDIEILDEHPAVRRYFARWAFKLVTPSCRSAPWQLDAIDAPPALLRDLRARSELAPSLLIKFSLQASLPAVSEPAGIRDHTPSAAEMAAPVLQRVFRDAVVPRLAARHAAESRPLGRSSTIAIARLLIAADGEQAERLLRRAAAQHDVMQQSNLIEPMARALGDLWRADQCNEVDVTIGLCRLQTAMRRLQWSKDEIFCGCAAPPSVLIAPEPGEHHILGAALDTDALHFAGWAPRCAFPNNDSALEALLNDGWVDVLDLSLSVALRREHWLPRLGQTIKKARRASKNPNLVVIVSGRIFAEQASTGSAVGANAASGTACRLDELILRSLGATVH